MHTEIYLAHQYLVISYTEHAARYLPLRLNLHHGPTKVDLSQHVEIAFVE